MTEREATTKLINLLKQKGMIIYKIPDDRNGISVKKPFDLFGAFHEKPLYAEVKITKTKAVTIAPSRFQPHQKESLIQFKEKIPYAIVGIFLAHQPEKRKKVSFYFKEVSKTHFLDEFYDWMSLDEFEKIF